MIGSLLFASSLQNGSWGSDSERSCPTVGSSCSASPSSGGGLLFSLGYMWQPVALQPAVHVGFDFLFGATVDAGSRSFVHVGGAVHSYAVERVGGLTAVRVRAALQSRAFRVAFAAGPGMAFRAVGIAGDAPGIPSDGGTYRAIAFTGDGSVQVRLGPSTALALGVMAWSEDAGPGLQTSKGPAGGPFTFVSGWNTTLLPYAGFQFGQ